MAKFHSLRRFPLRRPKVKANIMNESSPVWPSLTTGLILDSNSCVPLVIPRALTRRHCSLRTATATSTLVIPSTRRTTLGDRAFPVTAARAWDALPSSVRSVPSSLLQFRRDLKTRPQDGTVSVIVLFTTVSSCVTDCTFLIL